MKRKYSPLHDLWHRRVEGQIRHTMGCHPEWFNVEGREREALVNSLAKRIVGEIVAGVMVVTMTEGGGDQLPPAVEKDG